MECYERTVLCEHNEAPNNKRVQLNLYISHKAALRKSPTKEGFTHDWMVMLTGDEKVKLDHLIEKVVFRLHPTFPNSKRGFKSPPYQVVESGYGGFTMPVDVHLKVDEEPKIIRFMYTLYLGITPTVSHCRCERIIFQNPSRSFLEKLHSSGAMFAESSPLYVGAELDYQKTSKKRFITAEDDLTFESKKRFIMNETNETVNNQPLLKAPVKSVPAKKRGRPKKNSKTFEQNKENVEPTATSRFQDCQITNEFHSILTRTPLAQKSHNDDLHGNLSLSMNSFFRDIQNDPSMASTPISSKSILKKTSAPSKKPNLKLRFKSYVEEYSLGDDEKIILHEGMREYRKKLLEQHMETSTQSRLAPLKDSPIQAELNPVVQRNYQLLALQRTLMSTTDKKVLKKVVKIIDDSGLLKITKNSVDFDLCSLDDVTLEKVRQCLSGM